MLRDEDEMFYRALDRMLARIEVHLNRIAEEIYDYEPQRRTA